MSMTNPAQSPLLMIPGPTPLPDRVREALGRPAIGHRSAEFKAVLRQVFPALRRVFRTESDVLMYTAGGTGTMDAAIQNTLNPGDNVLSLCCGVFSSRWGDVAESYGMQVERQTVPMGQPNSVDELRARLKADTGRQIKAVMLTHSETSTGVLNPLQEMASVVREHGALLIVDAITSLGAAEVRADDWGLDMVAAGSQKGFMIPPGLSFLSVSPRAWEAHAQVRQPGYYFNFKRNKKAQDEDTTAFTPATPQVLALAETLSMIEAEGLDAVVARHRALRDAVRAGVRELGLTPVVADDRYASHAVTAVYPPEGLSVDALRKQLRERFGIVVADGQKELKGKIFRIGHLGHVGEREVLMTLQALKAVLKQPVLSR